MPLHDFGPVQGRAAKVEPVGRQGRRRLPLERLGIVDAARQGREGATLPGQLDAGAHGVVADELHDLGRKLLTLRAAVADAGLEHQIAQAHDAQADAPAAAGRLFDLGHSRYVLVGIHHVVQEAGRQLDRFLDLEPVHAAIRSDVLGQVDRAQAAVLVRSEPLLAAGVGRLQLVQVRHGIAPVGSIQEQGARLAVAVGVLDDLVEYLPGGQPFPDAAVLGVDQVILPVGLHGAHERVGNAHRDVKVGDVAFLALAADELQDVGVIDAQGGHVGPPARASLGDLAKGLVIHPQKADRPGGQALAGVDPRSLGPQLREGKAVAAAGLLDQRGHAQRGKNAGRIAAHVVLDRQDETGSELPERRPGPGEGGRVGHEAERGQHTRKRPAPLPVDRRHIRHRARRRRWPPAKTSALASRPAHRPCRAAGSAGAARSWRCRRVVCQPGDRVVDPQAMVSE